MKRFYFIFLFASVILISCNENKTSDTQAALKTAIKSTKDDSLKQEYNDAEMYKFRESKRRAAALLDSLKKNDPDLYNGLFFELYKSD